MSQVIQFGTDASVSFVSGAGALFNNFTINITQGMAAAVGFGQIWVTKRGTVLEASGTVSGFTTHGTSNDVPGIAAMNRTGNTMTLTFFTACTLGFTGILDGLGLGVQYTGNQTSGYSFQSAGAVTETWVSS